MPVDQSSKNIQITLEPYDNDRLSILCGACDENIQYIEKQCRVSISRLENRFVVKGRADDATRVIAVLKRLYDATSDSKVFVLKDIHMALQSDLSSSPEKSTHADSYVSLPKKRVKLYNAVQRSYYQNVMKHTINFAIGPSGTGKTYLAVVFAAYALLNKEVERIILVRPVVDAGEKLGFLPGDLAQKVDPYLRPFYDALYELISIDCTLNYIESGKIEIAPLAYMRGRTLSQSFIILDESQNTSQEQMKMLLTRLGQNSKIVITGDVTQIDLPRSQPSGLLHAKSILSDVEGISFTYFSKEHVVRHSLIQKIIEAYESKGKP